MHKGAGAAFSFLVCLCTSWEHGALPMPKVSLGIRVWGWHWVLACWKGHAGTGIYFIRAARSLISLGIEGPWAFGRLLVAANSVMFGGCGKLPALLSPAQPPFLFSNGEADLPCSSPGPEGGTQQCSCPVPSQLGKAGIPGAWGCWQALL